MQSLEGQAEGNAQEALLMSVAEQLKQPLLYIARSSELSLMEDKLNRDLVRSFEAQATSALRLLDSYVLGMGLDGQTQLELESVGLGALLSDVAHELSPLARQYDVDIELALDGKYGPVMTHSAGLRAALHSLGSVIIGLPTSQRGAIVRLSAHRSNGGIVTGLYHSSMERLPRSKSLLDEVGRFERRQPLSEIGGGSAAGVFVAQRLFRSMDTSLQMRKHKGLHGFAAELRSSPQLSLL